MSGGPNYLLLKFIEYKIENDCSVLLTEMKKWNYYKLAFIILCPQNSNNFYERGKNNNLNFILFRALQKGKIRISKYEINRYLIIFSSFWLRLNEKTNTKYNFILFCVISEFCILVIQTGRNTYLQLSYFSFRFFFYTVLPDSGLFIIQIIWQSPIFLK